MTAFVPVPVALEPTPEVIGILEEYLAELEAGARPNPEELVTRFPEMAEPLKACLASLELLQDAALSLRGSGRSEQPTALENMSEFGQLGDFRLVREVGRGGMGVVYEANQISLGRRVALKVLPFAAALDSRQLQRFKNEAQAAASLHHRHIVPVFGVGCDRGTHYYAMQYIEGQTLAAIIGNLRRGSACGRAGVTSEPSDRHAAASSATPPRAEPSAAASPGRFRAAALLGMQAAEALDHAHQLGVVHRDIKPANLLVESISPFAFEEAGAEAEGVRLWVTDFGLAHCRQGPVGLTLTGDLVGTLRYMSPEQALAQPTGVDHRTDIYSLGATLYEFLTLEPTFDGRDRQELLRQIALEEPKPVRRVNKAIPLDLETIVLKAMAKNPAERYATARELDNDLRRFLRDEPILARRSTPLQRTTQVGTETPAGDGVGGGDLARGSDGAGGQRRLDRARPGRAAGQEDRRTPGRPDRGATIPGRGSVAASAGSGQARRGPASGRHGRARLGRARDELATIPGRAGGRHSLGRRPRGHPPSPGGRERQPVCP